MKSLSKNKMQRRTKEIGDIEFRTEDGQVDLDANWKYAGQMLEVCKYMGVRIVWLRSDNFRCYAGSIAITVNPPTTAARLITIAHEAAHVGFRHMTLRLDRHRKEFETGSFEAQFARHCGIEPTFKQINDGKLYVANLIRMAIRRGGMRFDRESWEYARSGNLPGWIEATLDSIEPILVDKSRDNGFRAAMIHFS